MNGSSFPYSPTLARPDPGVYSGLDEQEVSEIATPPKVYEGTWDELAARADELRIYPRLTLIVPPQDEGLTSHYRADLTPEQRIRMLDSLAERNRHIPALPPEAFDRESLYADE